MVVVAMVVVVDAVDDVVDDEVDDEVDLTVVVVVETELEGADDTDLVDDVALLDTCREDVGFSAATMTLSRTSTAVRIRTAFTGVGSDDQAPCFGSPGDGSGGGRSGGPAGGGGPAGWPHAGAGPGVDDEGPDVGG